MQFVTFGAWASSDKIMCQQIEAVTIMMQRGWDLLQCLSVKFFYSFFLLQVFKFSHQTAKSKTLNQDCLRCETIYVTNYASRTPLWKSDLHREHTENIYTFSTTWKQPWSFSEAKHSTGGTNRNAHFCVEGDFNQHSLIRQYVSNGFITEADQEEALLLLTQHFFSIPVETPWNTLKPPEIFSESPIPSLQEQRGRFRTDWTNVIHRGKYIMSFPWTWHLSRWRLWQNCAVSAYSTEQTCLKRFL